MARPVATVRNPFAVSLEGHLLILFHWIEGQTVGYERVADDVLAKVAWSVGKLHKSTPQIEWPNPPCEFSLDFPT